jgi:hypothetical protein
LILIKDIAAALDAATQDLWAGEIDSDDPRGGGCKPAGLRSAKRVR